MTCSWQWLAIGLAVYCVGCGDDTGPRDADTEGAVPIDGEGPSDASSDEGADVVAADATADVGPRWDGRDLPDVVWDLPACATTHGVIARDVVSAGRAMNLAAFVATGGQTAVAWDADGPHVARVDGLETVEISLGGTLPDEIVGLAFDGGDLLAAGTFSEGGTPLLGLVSLETDVSGPIIANDPPWAAYVGLTGLWIGSNERWIMGVLEPRGPGEGETGAGLRILHVSTDFVLLSAERWLETGADTGFPEPGIVRVVGGPDRGVVVRKVIADERGRSPRALEIIPFDETGIELPSVLTLHGAYAGIDDVAAADMRDGTLAVILRSRVFDIPAPTLLASTVSQSTGAPLAEATVFAETSGGAVALAPSGTTGVDVIWQPVATQLLRGDDGHPLSVCPASTDLVPCAAPLRLGAGAYADAVRAQRDGAALVILWHETGPMAVTEMGARRVEGIYWARLACD